MDFLRMAGEEARLGNELLRVVAAMSRQEGGLDEALRKLKKFAAGSADEAVRLAVGTLLEELGVPAETVRERLQQFSEVVDLLGKELREVHDQPPVQLPLETGSRKSPSGKSLSLEGEASLTASLEADHDGKALDGRIAFGSDEVLLRYAVEGKLGGRLSHEANLGAGSGGIGVEAGTSLLLENHFRHRASQRVLDALLEDLASFRLPGTVDEALDLRHRVQVDAAGGRLCIPDQWIHLEARGNLELKGSLSVSQGSVRALRVRSQEIDLDEPVTVTAGLQARAGVTQKLEGWFDVLISHASPPGQLLVEIGKSNASERQAGLEVSAALGVEGLDGVAKAVLDGFLPKVTALVERAEKEVGDLPNLEKLFAARLEDEVDDLVEGNEELLAELRLLGTLLGVDLDLKQRFVDLATEAALDLAEDELAAIDRRVDDLEKLVQELANRYRKALKRLADLLAKAAKIKVGISVAYRRQRSRGREALLAFRIDPELQPERLRELLLGRIQPSLDAWERREPGLVLEDGLLVRKGSFAVSTGFQLDLVGLPYDHGRFLAQDWEERISPTTGDIVLGVRTELKGRTAFFLNGRLRTLTFLADAEVLALLGKASALVDSEVRQTITLALTERLETSTVRNVRRLEERWQEVGVLPPGTGLEGRLLAISGEDRLRGPLQLSAVLDLDAAALERLASTPEDGLRRIFAEAMIGTVSKGQLAARIEKRPLLLDPEVLEFLKEIDQGGVTTKKARFTLVPNWSPRLTELLLVRRRYLEAFVATVGQLGPGLGGLAGLDKAAALARIRQQQRSLMRHAKVLVQGELLGDGGLGYAFFEALAIAATGSAANAFTVIEYSGRTFVFAAPSS